MNRVLTTACLLGGAILIWLTLLGTVVVGVGVAALYSGSDSSSGSSHTYTDPLGNTCSYGDSYLVQQTGDVVCP
jgi:hypothetical protein